MKVIELDHVRRIRKGDVARTAKAATTATISLANLVAAVRRAPLRPERRELLNRIWAEFDAVEDR